MHTTLIKALSLRTKGENALSTHFTFLHRHFFSPFQNKQPCETTIIFANQRWNFHCLCMSWIKFFFLIYQHIIYNNRTSILYLYKHFTFLLNHYKNISWHQQINAEEILVLTTCVSQNKSTFYFKIPSTELEFIHVNPLTLNHHWNSGHFTECGMESVIISILHFSCDRHYWAMLLLLLLWWIS